ncbi:MAG: DUF1801 domain-containing protein [Pseudomonadota bacterium]
MKALDKADMVDRLKRLALELAPGACLKSIYGGTVIELETGNSKSRIGGFYVYDAHVSLELSKGHTFQDSEGFLEGSGKYRRHVKLYEVADIETKRCREFLQQAISDWRLADRPQQILEND